MADLALLDISFEVCPLSSSVGKSQSVESGLGEFGFERGFVFGGFQIQDLSSTPLVVVESSASDDEVAEHVVE